MEQAVLGEFLGTALLILLGNGVVANVSLKDSKGKDAGWLAINIGWGLAVMVAAFASGYLSGAHLNPAVTLAFAIQGSLKWNLVLPYILAQMAGAIVGQVLVYLHYYEHYQVTEDGETILGTFSTGPAIPSDWNNLLSEAIGTFVLVFGILSFTKTIMVPGLGTAVVGALIISIGVSLGGPTGYAINPARDLGPRLVHAFLPMDHKGSSHWEYAWIPVVGPMIGGALAAYAFMMI